MPVRIYPRRMPAAADAEPHSPGAAAPAGAGRGGPPGTAERGPGQREREGPLLIGRLRKDDGRALILYSHAPSEAQDPPA